MLRSSRVRDMVRDLYLHIGVTPIRSNSEKNQGFLAASSQSAINSIQLKFNFKSDFQGVVERASSSWANWVSQMAATFRKPAACALTFASPPSTMSATMAQCAAISRTVLLKGPAAASTSSTSRGGYSDAPNSVAALVTR